MISSHEHKEILQNVGIISSLDYERTLSSIHWTDMWLYKVEKLVTPESKYILLLGPEIDKDTPILYHPNLQSIVNSINERMIKSNSITGYDNVHHRVHGHLERDGILRIGNKSKDPLIIQFEKPSLLDLLKRNNTQSYLRNLDTKTRHTEIQSLLIKLGLSMGFHVKVAINDRNKSFKHEQLKNAATLKIEDLNIKNMVKGESLKTIDRIDVIWYDSNRYKIAAAFEIEFSGGYNDAYNRLGELNKFCNEYISSLHSVLVGDDFRTAYEKSRMEVIRSNFLYNRLSYLSIEKLAEFLDLSEKLGFGRYIATQRDVFFNRQLYQMNKGIYSTLY